MAFGAILLFFVSVGTSVGGMYIPMFKDSVPEGYFVAFPTFLIGLIAFFIAVVSTLRGCDLETWS
jgi:hypothetical protein